MLIFLNGQCTCDFSCFEASANATAMDRFLPGRKTIMIHPWLFPQARMKSHQIINSVPLLPPQVLLGPGAQWKAVKEALPPSKFTYVHGQCGSVGVGGFLLGGGNNPATSARYGYGADNVDEYTVVTANGSIVKVRQKIEKDNNCSCYNCNIPAFRTLSAGRYGEGDVGRCWRKQAEATAAATPFRGREYEFIQKWAKILLKG